MEAPGEGVPCMPAVKAPGVGSRFGGLAFGGRRA
jgi:hypothetical protein